MKFDLTWEISVLVGNYAETIKTLNSEDYNKEDEIKKTYAKAIELNMRIGYGLVMPIDMAIEDVKHKGITDYDGIGFLHDENGEEIGCMRCNVSFLEKAKEIGACFVAWYNK